MKLLFCTQCCDVVKITQNRRWCACGACTAVLLDPLRATACGKSAVVLGISNLSLATAVLDQQRYGDLTDRMGGIYGDAVKGREFCAFICPASAPTVFRTSADPQPQDTHD